MKKYLVALMAGIFLLTGCATQPLPPGTPVSTQPQPINPPPPKEETITLTATGDILMHSPQIVSGLQADGTYNFDTFFAPVKNLIEEGDYSSATFEAALAGPQSGYTGYPRFNSPDEIANTMTEAGYDLVNTANNHILDRDYTGALRTLDVLRNSGLDTTGAFKTPQEQKSFLIKDIRGVKVGYLAYTYGTNGIPVPENHPELVNILDEKQILTDIAALRPQVDALILIMHWGEEYNQQATQEQKRLAREFLAAGADAILGSHPHVVEPMEILNIDGKDKFVIYSMGNFISNQHEMERKSGLVLKLKFTKNFASGATRLSEASYTPTYTHVYTDHGKIQYRVIPIEQSIQNIKENKDPYLSTANLSELEQSLAMTKKLLGSPFYTTNK